MRGSFFQFQNGKGQFGIPRLACASISIILFWLALIMLLIADKAFIVTPSFGFQWIAV